MKNVRSLTLLLTLIAMELSVATVNAAKGGHLRGGEVARNWYTSRINERIT